MRKALSFIIIFIISFSFTKANTISQIQRNAKNEIYNAIRKIGTNIDNTEDESIFFEYKDIKYLASIKSYNHNTLYLSLMVIYNLSSDKYVPEVANIAAYNASSEKPVCSFFSDESLVFSCEMYAKNAGPFIQVLPEMLDALIYSSSHFQEEYDKALHNYIPITSNVNTSTINNNEYIYPYYISNNDSKLYIEKVTLSDNNTILDLISYNRRKYDWCSISKDSYISANGKRYPLLKAEGINFSPNYTYYPNSKNGKEVCLRFRLIFPSIPKNTTSFDFSEGGDDGWNIQGINLEHGPIKYLNSKIIESTHHKWECVSVEARNGQTVLRKKVTPKTSGTYIFSSQEEYIEDADTGRKYYLMNSSIGFEGSPQSSYDTNPITFYEIYPALPLSVKRINISSGSDYYVKNLLIR